jgi:gas vesicle protein
MRNGDYYRREYHGSQFADWSAFLAGTFIGAGLALLLTPQTGSELRGVLRNYAAKTKDEVLERGREAWDTAMERGHQTLQQAGQRVREHVESGQEKMKEAGGEAAAKFKESSREAKKKGQPA